MYFDIIEGRTNSGRVKTSESTPDPRSRHYIRIESNRRHNNVSRNEITFMFSVCRRRGRGRFHNTFTPVGPVVRCTVILLRKQQCSRVRRIRRNDENIIFCFRNDTRDRRSLSVILPFVRKLLLLLFLFK